MERVGCRDLPGTLVDFEMNVCEGEGDSGGVDTWHWHAEGGDGGFEVDTLIEVSGVLVEGGEGFEMNAFFK